MFPIRNPKRCYGICSVSFRFKLPDAMLNAPIGYYDGDIYNNYYAEVLKNNPPEAPGPGKPNYHEVLTTMLRRDYEPEENLAKLGK